MLSTRSGFACISKGKWAMSSWVDMSSGEVLVNSNPIFTPIRTLIFTPLIPWLMAWPFPCAGFSQASGLQRAAEKPARLPPSGYAPAGCAASAGSAACVNGSLRVNNPAFLFSLSR